MKTIFHADNSRSIRELVRTELQKDGYAVISVRDGETVINLVSENRPSLIILDVWMPRMDGLETLRRIKAHAPDLPVALFAVDCGHYRQDSRAQLADAWVEKQEDLGPLRAAVARILRDKAVVDR
jgi:DNA-binding response OmpR family regulator